MRTVIVNEHAMAPSKKYFVSKVPKKGTKVMLLLKDDKQPYLTAIQRADLLEEVGKEYATALKKEQVAHKPKLSISHATSQQLDGKLTMDELIKGIKEGWIVV